MTKNEIDRRVGFLGSPAAGMLERARIMLELASDGMKLDNKGEAEKWGEFARAVLVGAMVIRDQLLDDLRRAESGIVLAAPVPKVKR